MKLGQRVKCTGHESLTGIPHGTLGTVAEVATVGGRSIYPDPSRLMIFVRWDNGEAFGVFRRELAPHHPKSFGGALLAGKPVLIRRA